MSQSKFDVAESILKEVITIQKVILPPFHRNTLITMTVLACCYCQQNDHDKHIKAEKLLNLSILKLGDIYGKDHPDVVNNMNNYLLLLEKMGVDVSDQQTVLERLSRVTDDNNDDDDDFSL